MKFSPLKMIRDQLTPLPELEPMDLSGRTVLVTGSNVGLGLEAARHFARMQPARLILTSRDAAKGEAARKSILESMPSANVECWSLDLADFASTVAFCKRANAELDRLDTLFSESPSVCLNAGVSIPHWTTTKDGYETVLQVNVISTGLMAVLLLPLVQRTAALPAPTTSSAYKPHITFTASDAHFFTSFKEGRTPHPLETLSDRAQYGRVDRYNVSKLLNIYEAREVGKLAGPSVTVNACNPSLCESELMRSLGWFEYVLNVAKWLLARTTEAGSRTIVWAALNETPQAAYSQNCRVEEESDYALSPESDSAQAKLWADLKALWIKTAPEAADIL